MVTLANNAVLAGQAGATGSEQLYRFRAVHGKTLSITTAGDGGNVSVYVSYAKEPSAADCRATSTRPGNNESVRIAASTAGTYYIKLIGENACKNLRILARQ